MIKKRLAQASVAGLANSVVNGVSALVVAPIVIHALGQSDYGIWIVALSIVAYSRLLDRGLHNSAVRFLGLAIGKDDSLDLGSVYKFFRRYYHLSALGVIAVSTFGAIGAMQLVSRGSEAMVVAGLTGILGVATGCTFFITIHSIFLKASLQYHFISGVGIAKALFFTGGVYAVDRWAMLDLNTLLALHISAQVLEQISVYLYSRRLLPSGIEQSPAVEKTQRRDILIYSSKNVLSLLSNILRQHVDKQVLAAFVSLPAVAQYSIGNKLPMMMSEMLNSFFGGSFLATFSQMLSARGKEGITAPLFISVRLCAIITLTGATGIFFLGPPFIERWLGPGFEDAQLILQVVVLSTIASKIQFPLYSYMSALGHVGRMAGMGFASAFLNLVLSLALVHKFGLLGVVAAKAVDAALMGLVLHPALFSHVLQIPYPQYLWRTVLFPLLVFLALAWPVGWWTTNSFLLESWWAIGLAAAAFGLYMAVISWLFVSGKTLRHTLIAVIRESLGKSRP